MISKLVLLLAMPFVLSGAPQGAADKVNVGISKSIFVGRLDNEVDDEIREFKTIMERQTNRRGTYDKYSNYREMAEKLNTGELQLLLCNGYEMAWIAENYPDLRPLVVAINKQPYVRACIVVREDSPLRDYKDLQGRTLAHSKRTKPYCKLFLERRIEPLTGFFKSVISNEFRDKKDGGRKKEVTEGSALDLVASGEVDAALVNSVALDGYLKSANVKLRELEPTKSFTFPPTVVIYRAPKADGKTPKGGIDPATQKLFQEKLFDFHKLEDGGRLLYYWRLTAFVPVPSDYDAYLQKSRAEFPEKK